MAEVAIKRNLFADILRLIAELRPPPVAWPPGKAWKPASGESVFKRCRDARDDPAVVDARLTRLARAAGAAFEAPSDSQNKLFAMTIAYGAIAEFRRNIGIKRKRPSFTSSTAALSLARRCDLTRDKEPVGKESE
jgi:hypothetical protein